MNKLKEFARISAIPIAVLIAPACASLSFLAENSRVRMVKALGGEYDGKQSDGSYIKCLSNGTSAFMAEANFKARSNKYDPSKEVITEEVSNKNDGTTCARAYHEEMGSKLEKTDATAMDTR